MPKLHTAQMGEFADAVRAAGSVYAPAVAHRFVPIELEHDTVVDQQLSPYSDEYFAQQVALYEEIAGRKLDQASGELHPMDIEPFIAAPNPSGTHDVLKASEEVRALATMASLSCLPEHAHVLDLGAGGGMSSEVLAYVGCRVHAVDIDPLLGTMSRERARRKDFEITRSDMNFDDVGRLPDRTYDGAFFYQSFHHCLKPWKLVEDLASKLKADGVIGFAGEPVQARWWKNWGLRLDEESLFAARELGWFESGFSHSFIKDCFARAGFQLRFFTGGLFGGELGIAARSQAKLDEILARADLLGLSQTGLEGAIPDTAWANPAGARVSMFGRPANRQTGDGPALLFGPYIDLKAGAYRVSMILTREPGEPGADDTVTMDIVTDLGRTTWHKELIGTSISENPRLIVREVRFDRDIDNLEIRAVTSGSSRWSISLPTIEAI